MLKILLSRLSNLSRSEKGQDLTEYALLVTFIAVIVVLAVAIFGTSVSTAFSSMGLTVSSYLTP